MIGSAAMTAGKPVMRPRARRGAGERRRALEHRAPAWCRFVRLRHVDFLSRCVCPPGFVSEATHAPARLRADGHRVGGPVDRDARRRARAASRRRRLVGTTRRSARCRRVGGEARPARWRPGIRRRARSATAPLASRPRCLAATSRSRSARTAIGAPPSGDDVVAADEAGDELGARRVEHLARRARLLDAAAVHHDDEIGQRHRLVLAVRDVDERDAELASASASARRAS